jgi:hypothetical protein
MTSLERFLQNCEDICASARDVSIDRDRARELARSFKTAAAAPAWNDYISPAAQTGKMDATRVLFEMSMICAQQGGFIAPDAAGVPQKWAVNGSGAKAMLNKMDELRKNGVLPGLDITDPAEVDGKIGPFLKDVPFAKERLEMFREFAAPGVYQKLDALVKSAWDEERKAYRFDFDFVNALADLFPQSFAADPFRKKSVLSVLMTSAHAASRGVTVETETPVAADYVLPQVLEGLGVLKLSDGLRERLVNKEGMGENDPAARELRAATVAACAELARGGAKTPDIDAFLWLAGRDPAVKPKLLPAMNVYTTWF